LAYNITIDYVLVLQNIFMTYTSISPKFQIVIPKEVRRKMALRPKQRLIVMEKRGIIHLIPEVPLAKMKGFLKGLDIIL